MQSLPIILTIIAGLSTLIGYIFILFPIKNINKYISISLAFAAGVILCISFFDLLPNSLRVIYNQNHNLILTVIYFNLFFIIGYSFIKILKKIENNNYSTTSLYRVGLMSFIILFIHNALEGIATYSTSVYDTSVGISLTIAIIMHNIPEGILIAVPIYYATKNRLKAFSMVLFSALAEPIGAVISYLLFRNIYTEVFISYILLMVGGLMISLIINEIFPKLKDYKRYIKSNILFFIIGSLFILINLYLF